MGIVGRRGRRNVVLRIQSGREVVGELAPEHVFQGTGASEYSIWRALIREGNVRRLQLELPLVELMLAQQSERTSRRKRYEHGSDSHPALFAFPPRAFMLDLQPGALRSRPAAAQAARWLTWTPPSPST